MEYIFYFLKITKENIKIETPIDNGYGTITNYYSKFTNLKLIKRKICAEGNWKKRIRYQINHYIYIF